MTLPRMLKGDWLTIRLQWRRPCVVVASIMRERDNRSGHGWTVGAVYEGIGASAVEAISNMKRTGLRIQN